MQAFALLANYLQKLNRPSSGFTLLGIAVNMAQGLGLHREFSGLAVSVFDMEIRRRVWWTIFIFNSEARFTFGRPTLGLSINTQLLRNLDDNDLAVDLDELPPRQKISTTTLSLIWQMKLAKLSNLANVEKQFSDEATMLALGDEVSQWTASLPEYMRADYVGMGANTFAVSRMVLLWRLMHLRIVIHRPFLLNQIKRRNGLDFSNTSLPTSRCFLAAEECVSSILNSWNITTDRPGSLVWYACYWSVTEIFVHVTCLMYEPQHTLALIWRQQVDDAKKALEKMGTFESTALRAAHILDKIISLVHRTPDSAFFAMNDPIRMEVAELWNQSWTDMVVSQEPSPQRWL